MQQQLTKVTTVAAVIHRTSVHIHPDGQETHWHTLQ